MVKKIIIKEVDKLYSKKFKDKIVSEYLIYLTLDNTKIMCYQEIGESAKKERVNMILLEHFTRISINTSELNEIIEEITLD